MEASRAERAGPAVPAYELSGAMHGVQKLAEPSRSCACPWWRRGTVPLSSDHVPAGQVLGLKVATPQKWPAVQISCKSSNPSCPRDPGIGHSGKLHKEPAPQSQQSNPAHICRASTGER
eukprot:6933434-Prymnesium_polylepis.2